MVQGVGFRPFVHRLAVELDLSGHVGNDSAGVVLEVEGRPDAVERFESRLVDETPPLARVDECRGLPVDVAGGSGFRIIGSEAAGPVRTFVSPDMAVCDDCLADLFDPADRRYRYPFVNCTNCGPRFTITTALPYDRPNTTMSAFPLCQACAEEYGDPCDRRFHAQPIACAACGPHLRFEDDAGAMRRVRRGARSGAAGTCPW